MSETRKADCALCGRGFSSLRDRRRWRALAWPLAPELPTNPTELSLKKRRPRAQRFIVCTDCFLELAEAEYAD